MNNLDKEIKKEIVKYCREVIAKLDLTYLKKNDVYKNEFLEFLYLTCIANWEKHGEYILTEENISILFAVKKHNEMYMKKIKDKEVEIKGIDKFDNLIIDENELIDRTEDEGEQD
jgi:hypothetical protein